MLGITAVIAVSVGSAAGVITVVARQHAPEGGWVQLFRDGVRGVRKMELSVFSGLRSSNGEAGGLDQLFDVAEPVEWPAYTEVSGLRSALGRAARIVRR